MMEYSQITVTLKYRGGGGGGGSKTGVGDSLNFVKSLIVQHIVPAPLGEGDHSLFVMDLVSLIYT